MTIAPDAERVVTIRNRRGLHARAAAKLVTIAERFDADIEVRVGGGEADSGVSARSIMGLMMLGAGVGSIVTLSAGGKQASEAVAALAGLIESGFDEQD